MKEIVVYRKDANGRVIDNNFKVEEYLLDRKTGKRHGNYKRYDADNILAEEGAYLYGQKVGIWKEYNYTDSIWIHYDFDQNGIATPIIPRGYDRHPTHLVETIGYLFSGTLRLGYAFSGQCELLELKIVEGVHPLVDEFVRTKFRRYVELKNKYNEEIEECTSNKDTVITLYYPDYSRD